MEAFDCKDRKSGKVLGSQLMREPDVNQGIKSVMDYHGLTRSYRVKKLRTHLDHPDPNISLKALDQSWRLDGYIEKHLGVGIDIKAVISRHEETVNERQALEAELKKLKGTDD